MDDRKKEHKDLLKKKIGELRKIAGRYSIEIKPTWTRDKIAKLIIERRYKKPGQDLAQEKINIHDRKVQQTEGRLPAEQPPVNPDFEAAAQVAEQPEKQEKRGGVREGAGKPLGMTDEKARVKNLPQQPSNPIKHGTMSLFLFWSKTAKIDELALSEEEVDLWSLPATQLQENYFPGLIPEIAGVWVEFVYATIRIMKPRFDLIDEVRKQRRAAVDIKTRPAQGGGNGMLIHFKTLDGGPLHAVTPGDPFKHTAVVNDVTCETCKSILRNQGVSI